MTRLVIGALILLALFFASTTAYVLATAPLPYTDPCTPTQVALWSDRAVHDVCVPQSTIRFLPRH